MTPELIHGSKKGRQSRKALKNYTYNEKLDLRLKLPS
jgi:hypothetical protein